MSQQVDPSHIMQVGMGFWASKTLLSAVELELFTKLGSDGMTGSQIAEALELNARAIPDFPDALVALELLDREGEGSDALYRNTQATAIFLDKASPAYIGGILEMCNARLYRFWGDLTEALQTGKPQNEIKHTGKAMFEELYSDPDRLEQFMNAMAGISLGPFDALAEKFDFSKYETLCDVGGATGQLSIIVAGRHPHMRCTSFDLPVVEPIARRTIEAAGMSERVTAVGGDFFADPLPEGRRHHDGADPPRLESRAQDAPDQGRLRRAARRRRVHRHREPHRRRSPRERIRALDVAQHADRVRRRLRLHRRDFAGWCKEAGFKDTEIVPLAGPTSAGIAYK